MSVKYSDVKTRMHVRLEYRKASWPQGKTLSADVPVSELEWRRNKLIEQGYAITKEDPAKPVEYFDVFF